MRRKSQFANWTGADLERSVEKQAASETIRLLSNIRDAMLQAHAAGSPLHWILDVDRLNPSTRHFLLNTIGSGEVRITLHGGEARMEETDVPALWRLQLGEQCSLVATLLPRCVEFAAEAGSDTFEEPEDKPSDLFAAPTILTELREALARTDLSTIGTEPAWQIDLERQPLSPSDLNYLLATLGEGQVLVEMQGLVTSRIRSTKVRGVWRSEMLNNAGKTLMDSLVIAKIPPEVPASFEELPLSAAKLDETIAWLTADIERGAIG